AVDDFFPWLMRYTVGIKVFTLIVAGTCFLFSVSEVFANIRRRIWFLFLISTAATIYLAGLLLHLKSLWLFAGLLVVSTLFATFQAIDFYGWHSPMLYAMLLVLPYAVWAFVQILHGAPVHGLNYYLFGFFYVTGLVYLRHFGRFSPGVIFTSASFV